jgi:hypothetical protein
MTLAPLVLIAVVLVVLHGAVLWSRRDVHHTEEAARNFNPPHAR